MKIKSNSSHHHDRPVQDGRHHKQSSASHYRPGGSKEGPGDHCRHVQQVHSSSPKEGILTDQLEMQQDFHYQMHRIADQVHLQRAEEQEDSNGTKEKVQRVQASRYRWVDTNPESSQSQGWNMGQYCITKPLMDKISEHQKIKQFLDEFDTVLGNQIHKIILRKDMRRISEFD